ncbi:MAG: division/cell wall cluster transcriptional repressor MraZ [Planctomycetes bacterium]|nr:division/cell wall cluster transcriptional repressor MraZ [Planctomycetota bacterium]
MLLTGTHPRTLDEKKRLALPRRIREQLGGINRLYITQGQDQCLWLYGPAELEKLAEKIDQSPATDKEVRDFRRLFFAGMEETDIDRNARILIPERLIQFAGLRHEVVLLGVRDRLELWDKGRWEAYLDKNASRFDAAAEGAFQRGNWQRNR